MDTNGNKNNTINKENDRDDNGTKINERGQINKSIKINLDNKGIKTTINNNVNENNNSIVNNSFNDKNINNMISNNNVS